MTKIAIHNSLSDFVPRWIAYCRSVGLEFKLVNCYDWNILSQLHDCDALFWHHSQNDPKALIAAKPIIFALEHAGIKVFPDFKTSWHFDDKLGQKYLLEALNVPFVPTYVFYDKKAALNWALATNYPKVFKLRRGAGSANVKLIKSKKEAIKVIKSAFGKGFKNYDKWGSVKERYRKWRLGKTSVLDLMKGLARLFIQPPFSATLGREKGYVYFQDFIPGNDHDIRVIVIGNKAFAIKRMVRKNDFRASGSGHIKFEKELFDPKVISLSFQIHKKLQSQCTAMDFVFDQSQPKVVEISYGFSPQAYDPCPGYWDEDLNWHDGPFDPYGWMIEEVLRKNGK
ncbi:MAG: RimK family alpha-L-glutamate ligase [Ignavibacterium sp.]